VNLGPFFVIAKKKKIFKARSPVRLVKLFAPTSLLSPQDFLGDKVDTLGKVLLTGVQVSADNVVAATFDPKAPLSDADYLELTDPLDTLKDLTTGEFWNLAQSSTPHYLYYDQRVYQNFGKVSAHLPPNIPMEQKGILSPRLVFGSKGVQTKPFFFLGNTFLTVFHGEVELVRKKEKKNRKETNKNSFFFLNIRSARFSSRPPRLTTCTCIHAITLTGAPGRRSIRTG